MKPGLSVVGLNLAKSLFHLVGRDERGKIISLNFSQCVARKKWLKSRESPPCSSCQSRENRGDSSRPTRDHLYQLQPTTNC